MTGIGGDGATGPREDGVVASGLRFATEIAAWVATPWALAAHSWLVAALSVVVLIGLPTVFATPGDRPHAIIAVPGWVTVLLVLLQLATAVVFSWLAWPVWAAITVSLMAAATLITERPRRRRLLSRRSDTADTQ
ncbi:hypothetical protein [Streptomyces parvulus]|uniref:hypothetical protein n=1 Tax=Streptomyces parvulus TaxID=146923 RepID=UPI003F4D8D34